MGALLPRRFSRILRYLIAIFIIVIFLPVIYQTLNNNSSAGSSAGGNVDDSPRKQKRRMEVNVPDMPGLDQAAAALVKRDYWERYPNPEKLAKKDWHNYALQKTEEARKGPGEQGSAFRLPSDHDKKKKEELYRENGFNAMGSDLIAMNRSVKDIRHRGCKKKLYIEKLPSVSVILPFHNEHWSTLLRSVYSIVDRSPKEMLKEVILADDFSSKEFLKDQLDQYVKQHWPDGKVKVVRATKREGLIRARLLGAKAASGEILLFLDSHSECNFNWLPPVIEPIAFDYKTVVCPFVDVIDYETYEYRAQDEGARGSWDWELYYKRLALLPEDLKNPTEPFKSPVMAGGYFAISTKWFWELGGYDEGLDIWGGEQYELSFKLWQCGGQMVDAPCSRVGHIYRKFAPFPNPGVGDFIGRNYKRVAEVWMDEYKEYIYARRPHYRSIEAGDLTPQKAIREKLQCKPFKWYMENIAFDQPKKYPPVEPPDGARGEIRNEAANLCIDTRFKGMNERFELEPCIKDNPGHGGEQNFVYTWHKDIRPNKRNFCFDVSTSQNHAPVVLFQCHGMGGNQQWAYRHHSQQLYHSVSRLCLDCDPERREIFMSTCDSGKKSQRWKFESVNVEVVQRWQ